MKLRPLPFLTFSLLISIPTSLFSEVVPSSLFADHAVLQQGVEVPVWGTAEPSEKVTVTFADQSKTTTTASDGKWTVTLDAMEASATPRTLTIKGVNTLILEDILVGEVWICSGQSNMERQLGLRQGQQPIIGWEAEVAGANYPQIRQFYVPQVKSFDAQDTVDGNWTVCSPETAQDITAVGYFFGKTLHKKLNVPVGLIHSSWGGTPAEAWTSKEGLQELEDYQESLEQIRLIQKDPELAEKELHRKQELWFAEVDPGSAADPTWAAAELDDSGWDTMELPTVWEDAGYPGYDGVFWFRKDFDMPTDWDGSDILINLGAVDDLDTTWVNGQLMGSTPGYDTARKYTVSGDQIKATGNSIAVRVLDTGGGGGLWGNSEDALQVLYRAKDSDESKTLRIDGTWKCNASVNLENGNYPPMDFSQSSGAPTVLYNGMIHPLLPYAMKGVIWYQGEANVGKEKEYQTLFPAMIKDWRRLWGSANFPFLFVQIAPHQEMTPEIREAQLLSLQKTENTAMVVTIDCGDAEDIHPANKKPVGARLALAARALAYGEEIQYSGPIYKSMKRKGNKAILKFSEVGVGLAAPGGTLTGFTIAGKDGIFHPAEATIEGKAVVVTSPAVAKPTAVRYGWANVPEGNLFNQAGLPASPFRTSITW